MDDFPALIGQLGFPIAVAAFLLIRFDRTLKDLANAIQDLRLEIISRNKDGEK